MKPGDWVIVMDRHVLNLPGQTGRLFHLSGESAWWDLVDDIRLATPEEIAAGQLAGSQAGLL